MDVKKIFKDFFSIGSGTLVSMIIGIMTTPIITRLVDPIGYGEFTLFTTYSGIAVMILCLGLDQGLVRYYFSEDSVKYKRKLSQIVILIPFVASGIIALLLLFNNSINLLNYKFMDLLFIYTLIMVFKRFSMLIIRLERQTKLYSFINITNRIFYVVFALLFIYLFGSNATALLFAITLSSLLTLIYSVKKNWTIWKPDKSLFNKEIPIKKILKYSFPFIFTMGLTRLFNANDKLFLNYFGTHEQVGVFASATSIVNIINIIQSTFNTLWSPITVENYSKNPDDKSLYYKGNQIITVIMFAIGLTIILFKDVFVLLLGEEYRVASFIIPMLVFGPIMNTISETTVSGLVFKKKSNVQLLITIVTFIIDIILNVIFIPIYGAIGAAISTGISYILFFTLRTLAANRYYYINFRLKQFYIITFMTASYAIYTSFISFNIYYIIGYLLCISTLLFFYKDTVINSMKYVFLLISER